MNQEFKKQLNLPEGISQILTENIAAVRKLQAEIQVLNTKISDLMTGFCLAQSINLQSEGIKFSEDLRVLYVYDLPKEDVATSVVEKPKRTKSKKEDAV